MKYINQRSKILIISLLVSLNSYSQFNADSTKAEIFFTCCFSREKLDFLVSNVVIDSQAVFCTIANLGLTLRYYKMQEIGSTLKVIKGDKSFVFIKPRKIYKIKVIDSEQNTFVFKFDIRHNRLFMLLVYN